jgi:hypothetical protein
MRHRRSQLRGQPGAARLRHLPLSLVLATVLAWLAFGAFACSAPAALDSSPAPRRDATTAREGAPPPPAPRASPAGADAGAATPPSAPAQIDPDGDDDPEDTHASLPVRGVFTKVGTPPLALTRICDLTPLGDALYAAHANQPLGTDGATITRYRPDDASRPFTVAFDWNRPGEPTKGGGAGQGFTRVHAIGGRLFVPDADPPYGGLGLVDWGTEGYVFVSDAKGAFAPPRAPHFRPPAAPDLLGLLGDGGPEPGGKAGAGVLPRAYHVLDVVRFRGALFASTGSVPPKERAWAGPSPGALHRSDASGARWTYEVDYPFPYKNGVWRLTYMTRFRDRLYVGIQDYDGREPNDFLVIAPKEGAHALTRDEVRAVRITPRGATHTLRWWVDTAASPARLYWIGWSQSGVALRVTTDGDRWAVVRLPEGTGVPTDVKRAGEAVVILTDRGLHRLEGPAIDAPRPLGDDELREGTADVKVTPIALVDVDAPPAPAPRPGKKSKPKPSPFELGDVFCGAPLAVFRGEVYAGGQRGGALWKVVPAPP